jgi:hypothetical protein
LFSATFPVRPQVFQGDPLFSTTFPVRSLIFEVTAVVVAQAGNDILSARKKDGGVIREVPTLMAEQACIAF